MKYLVIIAIGIVLLATACNSNKHNPQGGASFRALAEPKQDDSVSYIQYRGRFSSKPDARVTEGSITPIYIPIKDSVFKVGDSITVNAHGVYNSMSTIIAVIEQKKGIVKFANDGK